MDEIRSKIDDLMEAVRSLQKEISEKAEKAEDVKQYDELKEALRCLERFADRLEDAKYDVKDATCLLEER